MEKMQPAWSLEIGKRNDITENDRTRSLMVKFKTKLLKNVQDSLGQSKSLPVVKNIAGGQKHCRWSKTLQVVKNYTIKPTLT
jgi:hypothetical protein